MIPRIRISLYIVAVTLYLFQVGAPPLWYDEAGTAWMASLPVERLIAATAGDTHPPLYLLIIAGVRWMFGDSPLVLRLPSVLFGLLTLAVCMRLTRQLRFSLAAETLALALLVMSPFLLHFAQESRMYALLQLEILTALYCGLTRRWWGMAVALTAALWTHNYALLYGLAIALVVLWQEIPGWIIEKPYWRDVWPPLAALAAPVLCFLPWVAVLLGQMQAIAGGYWIAPVTPGTVVDVLAKLLWWNFTTPDEFRVAGWFAATGLTAWITLRAIRDETARPLLVVALFPLALAVGASLVWRPVLLFRGLAPSVPLLWLLIGWALARLELRRRLYAAILLAPLLVAGLLGHVLKNPEQKTSTQPYAALIRAAWQPGDVVLHVNEGTLMEMRLPGADLYQVMLPACAPNPGGLSAATRRAMNFPEVDPARVAWKRAWIIWLWGPTVPQCNVDDARAFLQKYPALQVWTLRADDFVEERIYLVDRGQ